jgi:hypothetical protein
MSLTRARQTSRKSPGRRSAAKLLTKDEARRIAVNVVIAGVVAPHAKGLIGNR